MKMMGRSRRALGLASAAALGVSGLVVMASPAAAAMHQCGDHIMMSETLSNNIGPCPASGPNQGAGLVIMGNNVVLNLGGHTITGGNTTNMSTQEQPGIVFMNATNSTVTNGAVRNFDAGVLVAGGTGNTVSQIRAYDNINHGILTGTINSCSLGDGIAVEGADNTQVKSNTTYHNGPYSGIALVDDADNNVVSGNNSYNQTVSNYNPAFVNPDNPEGNGPCGPFSATPEGIGRLHQDIGIRIEGPGANDNQVLNNQATSNQLNGIGIHGYVCGVFPGGPPPGTPNTGNLVQGNNVRANGFPDGLDGIGILSQGPLGTITCASNNNSIMGNTSTGNAGSGIYISRTGNNAITSSNTISGNVVNSNHVDGIRLQGPNTVCPLGQSGPNNTCNVPRETRNGANNNVISDNRGSGNTEHDGHDGNVNCDANVWSHNIFGTVNQACVKANGGTGTIKLPMF